MESVFCRLINRIDGEMEKEMLQIESKILSEIQRGDRRGKIILKNWDGNTQVNGTHT